MAEKTFATKSKKKTSRSGQSTAGAQPASQRNGAKSNAGLHRGAGPATALAGIQTKVKIGKAGDAFEKEADAVADSVVANQPVPAISKLSGGSVNRMADEGEKDEKQDSGAAQAKESAESKEGKEGKEEEKKDESQHGVQRKDGEEAKKEEPSAQKKAEDEDKKEPEAQKKGDAGEEKKDEDAKAQRKEKEEDPVQKKTEKVEQESDKKEEGSAQRKEAAPEEEKKEEGSAQKAAAEEEKQEEGAAQKASEEKDKEEGQAQTKGEEDEKSEQTAQKKDDGEQDKEESGAGAAQTKSEESGEEEKQGDVQSKSQPQASTGSGTRAASPAHAAAPTAMQAAAARAITSKGMGQPLPPSVRQRLQTALGKDLGHVRVHQDGEAATANRVLRARAFTHGRDIWLGRGESPHNLKLMAHEVTHVVQQSNKIRRGTKGGKSDKAEDQKTATEYSGNEGSIKKNGAAWDISVKEVEIPQFKSAGTKQPITIPPSKDRSDKPAQLWDQDLAKNASGIGTKMEAKRKAEGSPQVTKNGKQMYYFRIAKESTGFIIGELNTVAKRTARPYWSPTGKLLTYEVDHIHEVQLGGPATDVKNFWLLELGKNKKSGEVIKKAKKKSLDDLLEAAKKEMAEVPTYKQVRKATTVKVEGVKPVDSVTPDKGELLEKKHILAGDQLEGLKALSDKEIKDDIAGSSAQLIIFTSGAGGGRRTVKWAEDKTVESGLPIPLGKSFTITQVEYNKASKSGKVQGIGKVDKKIDGLTDTYTTNPMQFDLSPMDAVDWGGYINRNSVKAQVSARLKELNGWSPVTLSDVDLDPSRGIVAEGKIKVTIPALEGAEIDLLLEGGNISLAKTFYGSEFKLPGPVKVTDSALTIMVGTGGVGVTGIANFEVKGFGKGYLKGDASTGGGLDVEGGFTPDSDKFESKITVWYRNQEFGGSGELKVGAGKIKGVKSASIMIKVQKDKWEGEGELVPELKAIKKGTLKATYDPAAGLDVKVAVELGEIPGVKSGKLEGQLKQKGDGFAVKVGGDLAFEKGPISGTVKADYDDGAFTAEANIDYKKKLVDGSIKVGVTNRAVDEKTGVPSGEGTDVFTIYGGGTVSITFTPWLKGTVGLQLKPNGEVVVSGEVALPSSFEVFPEKKVEKKIFSIGIDIPIVGLAVAGQRIGIFATIRGGLTAEASIGPGQLKDTKLSVTYNPSNEDETKVHGQAKFEVPAKAGLRLFVNGGLGAGIPIVSATAGLEVGATLGLEGKATAAAEIDWSPNTGIELKAGIDISVEPKFTFDVTGFVKVEADILIDTIELYSKRWNLASFEYGSGLKFGVGFPLHYKSGEPFNISLDDVKFTYPDIDASEILAGLIKKIA